jgi:hypothetical protein
MKYEIETDTDEKIVRIISDDDAILENGDAMDAVAVAVIKEWGKGAECIGEGSSYFGPQGTEDGWEWSVNVPAANVIKDYFDALEWAKEGDADAGDFITLAWEKVMEKQAEYLTDEQKLAALKAIGASE